MMAKEIKFKKTGIDWMPEIPEHWEVKRMKNVCVLQRGYDLAKDKFVEGRYPVYGSNGIIGFHKEYSTPAPCITIGRSGSTGEIQFIETDFWAHNTCLFIKESYGNVWKYLYYLLSSIDIKSISNGTAVPTLDRNNVHVLKVGFPPIQEQITIADHLDSQSAKITHFIQTKQRFIELLKEQRQSIITNAVTKGIDEKAKMKETGIEWMPEIPEHWEVRRLKYLVELYKHNKSGINLVNSDFKLALENIDNWTGKYIESVSPDFEGEGRYFKEGDVLFGKLRPYLAKAFLPNRNGVCVSEILVFTPNSELVTSEFLFQRILTKGFIDIIDGSTYGAKMPRASWNFIGNMRITFPPTIEEQKQIVEHIKTETRILDIAISKAEREIELIKEYREAMIAEAVTGKIKL